MASDGGYDDGYRQCSCFWGSEPGSLVRLLPELVPSFQGMTIWDVGCGEGKNAIYLARQKAIVDAWDVSELAIANAEKAWEDSEIVNWRNADARIRVPDRTSYNIVIMYGLLHCFTNHREIASFVAKCKEITTSVGWHVLVAFNDRHQELDAHPGFTPTLLAHEEYLGMYRDWKVVHQSDHDLFESHPHNSIPHVHSMTRLIAARP